MAHLSYTSFITSVIVNYSQACLCVVLQELIPLRSNDDFWWHLYVAKGKTPRYARCTQSVCSNWDFQGAITGLAALLSSVSSLLRYNIGYTYLQAFHRLI